MRRNRSLGTISLLDVFCYLLLDFHVKTGTRVSLWVKRLLEVSEIETIRVDCFNDRDNSAETVRMLRLICVSLAAYGVTSRKQAYIILTPLNPTFYIVKLGFTGVYIIFVISAKNINCGTRENRLAEAVLTSTHNLCFEQKYEKYQNFLSVNSHIFGGKIFYIFE